VAAVSAFPIDDEAVAGLADPDGLCRRVAEAMPGAPRTLVVAIGERLTTIILAVAEQPALLWTVAHAPLLVAAARADETKPLGRELIQTLREAAREALEDARVGYMRQLQCEVIGASRLARAVVMLGAGGGRAASARELGAALATLGATWEDQSARGGAPPWLRTTLVAAAMLEGILGSMGGGRILTLPEEGDVRAASLDDGQALRRSAG
jgi:type IV secretory pathway TrbD component